LPVCATNTMLPATHGAWFVPNSSAVPLHRLTLNVTFQKAKASNNIGKCEVGKFDEGHCQGDGRVMRQHAIRVFQDLRW